MSADFLPVATIMGASEAEGLSKMRTFRWVMAVLLLLCVVPVLCTLTADLIATVLGCELDLVAARECIVGGRDIGHALLVFGMLGYGQFFTTPIFILAATVWIVTEVVRWLWLRLRKPEAA